MPHEIREIHETQVCDSSSMCIYVSSLWKSQEYTCHILSHTYGRKPILTTSTFFQDQLSADLWFPVSAEEGTAPTSSWLRAPWVG